LCGDIIENPGTEDSIASSSKGRQLLANLIITSVSLLLLINLVITVSDLSH